MKVGMILRCRDFVIEFPRRPLIIGIVNDNDDTFCGDGTLDISAALAQARQFVAQGADIIDVGAESARTNREPIPVAEEIQRLLPFVRGFQQWRSTADAALRRDAAQLWPPLLSLNIWRTEVAAAVLPHGGEIFNDISALPTAANAVVCSQHATALLIMHSVGAPKVAHTHIQHADIMATLEQFFQEKIALAASAGLPEEQMLLDPGIDFAKQRTDNLRILAQLDRLHVFGRPILVPVSRKSVIGQVLGLQNPLDRDAGTLACLVAGLLRGAQIFRVHHVSAAAQAVKVLHGVMAAET